MPNGIKLTEFDPRVGRGELPVGFHLGLVTALRPGGDTPDQVGPFADPFRQIAGQSAEFNFGPVQPAPVLRRVVNLQPLGEPSSLLRRKSFIEWVFS
ncbi:hypothetical protein [Methylocaldum szegediense]|nr:hypothetical protein [Methylocaldum szegediense]